MTPVELIAFAASTDLLAGWRLYRADVPVVTTICIGGGMGAAGLFEVL